MSKLTISIFGNEIFPEILNKLNLFSKYKIISYDKINLILENADDKTHIIVFFLTKKTKKIVMHY